MLPRLALEPDLFFGVFRYLSIRDVARLLRSSREINDFISRNLPRIHFGTTFSFCINILHYTRALRGNSTDYNPREIAVEIRLLSKHDLLCSKFWKFEEIGDGMLLSITSKHIYIWIEKQTLWPSALEFFCSRFLCHFRIYELEVRLCEEKFCYAKTFVDTLAARGIPVEELRFFDYFLTEQQLFSIVKALEVQKLHLPTGRQIRALTGEAPEFIRQYREDMRRQREARKLSANFFRQLTNLHTFYATDRDCDIGDNDLQRFECLTITGESPRITCDGLYQWIMTRFEYASIPTDYEFSIVRECPHFRPRLENQLKEYFPTHYSNENGSAYRGTSGRWLRISGHISIRIHPSYAEYVRQNSVVRMNLTLIIGVDEEHTVKLAFELLECKREQIHTFEVSNKYPTTDVAILVDQLTDHASVYETGFQRYVIYIEAEEFDQNCIIDVLKAFGSRLKRQKYVKAACLSEPEDVAFQYLLAMREAWSPDYKISSLYTKTKVDKKNTSALLSTVIRSLKVKNVDIYRGQMFLA